MPVTTVSVVMLVLLLLCCSAGRFSSMQLCTLARRTLYEPENFGRDAATASRALFRERQHGYGSKINNMCHACEPPVPSGCHPRAFLI